MYDSVAKAARLTPRARLYCMMNDLSDPPNFVSVLDDSPCDIFVYKSNWKTR